MTTDLVPKTAFAEVKLRRGAVRVAGMTKGSGMIHPHMATTLGFVMTDAAFRSPPLRAMLKRGVERSYNRFSVDGDTSTNDTLVLLANGASGVQPDAEELRQVEEAVTGVMERLAQAIARDGEGARKFVTIEVTGAPSDDAAARIARAIANSPLVKTAIAGSDPNWGRILSAAGNAGVAFDPAKTDIHMQGVTVCRGGPRRPVFRARPEGQARRARMRDPPGPSRQGQGLRALLDLRPDRRLHPHQRQLPELVSSPMESRSFSPPACMRRTTPLSGSKRHA